MASTPFADEPRSPRPRKPVRVVPSDPGWPSAFDVLRAELAGVLCDGCAIHHVGSTAVPGLAAKPVIDVLVEAPALDALETSTPALVGLGFDARGEYGIEGRRYFSRPADEGRLSAHVHGFEAGDPHAARHLAFRDYLRAHRPEADAYGSLKTALAAAHPDDRDAYQDAKAAFCDALVERAMAWRSRRPSP